MSRNNQEGYRDIVDRQSVDVKAAVLKACPSIVSVITYNVPDEMIIRESAFWVKDRTYVCPGSGVIIESEYLDISSSYSTTIICPANLFKRTYKIQPHEIDFEVRVLGGKLYKGELLGCDYHYNLAVIKILSESPLCPATLMNLTHASSLDLSPNQLYHSRAKRPRPSDVNSFHIDSGDKIILVERSCCNNYNLRVSTGVLRTRGKFLRKEMFSISHLTPARTYGGAIINYLGDVIGISFNDFSFLPINIVSRWWNHYRSCMGFRRPCIGVEVVNLHEVPIDGLIQLVRKFPSIVTGVVVTKVENNHPAKKIGLESDDVIVKCDGDLVRSKLELIERVWDTAGQVVELDVLKARKGDQLKLSVTIREDNLYKWRLPDPYCIRAP